MSSEIVLYQPIAQQLTEKQVQMIANTDFVPDDKRNNVPAIWAAILKGREIGLGDMTSIAEINVIKGKPTYSAAAAAAVVRKQGHSLELKLGVEQATARGRRRDTGDVFEFTYTMQMARDAGLAAKDNWKKHKASMLLARAATQVCRTLFSDCFIGGVYTPEELEADVQHEPLQPLGDADIELEAEEIVETDTPWERLKIRLDEKGITRDDEFRKLAREIVPEGAPADITEEQAELIWKAVC